MALYEMTDIKGVTASSTRSFVQLRRTSFADEGIQERAHLQAALRDHIDLIDADLLVVAEEFGDFEGASRRIDLLCIDRDCRLVVVELKRTADGGHMELQALRYAAMISTMIFDQVVRAHVKYRKSRGDGTVAEAVARAELLAWLDVDDEEDPVIPRDVGIVLASEDFSPEITTTVLWLNEFHSFSIRCVRLSPYRLESRLLLDVQQVIPLPEASAYTVRVREKENSVKRSSVSSADWTKFIVQTPTEETEPLAKRWAVLRLVVALKDAGVPIEHMSQLLPARKMVHVDGTFEDVDELWSAIQQNYGKSDENRRRWHLDDAFPSPDGKTWVLHNNWGRETREVFEKLLAVAPEGFAVHEAGDIGAPPAG